MSFLKLAQAFRPAATRRFASNIAAHSTRGSYRYLAWGTAIGAATCLAVTTHKIHLDSPVQAANVEKDAEQDSVVDLATSIAFPKVMRIPSNAKIPLSLIGVGVRTVSFLGIKVYSVGFYADLGNPNLKVPLDMPTEDKIRYIVQNTACVIRIVPTRSTSFTHLRDAFMRALQSRLSVGIKTESISEDVAVEAASPLRKLKSLFPNSPLAKHTPLDVFLAAPVSGKPRALVFRDLGSVENDWVAAEFVLHYFEGDGPSPPLKAAVLENLKTFQK